MDEWMGKAAVQYQPHPLLSIYTVLSTDGLE